MSLNLDARQRAMLLEMGVRVWSPLPDPNAGPAAVVAPVRTSPGVAPLVPKADGVRQMDWSALQHAVSECRACPLCERRQKTVFGVGQFEPGADVRADWLFVGEAPGEQEDLQGEPFVGAAGQLLDNMLRAISLERKRPGVYIANVLKCRPPGNRNPEPDEVAQCAPYLQRQIELLQPRIIVALGRFAAQTLLHDTVPGVAGMPLGKLRGQVHRYRDTPVVVTYHPAYLLRALGDKAKAWADLCLAMESASSG
jgi:DNA polymerase